MNPETWKPVATIPGIEASSEGRIRRAARFAVQGVLACGFRPPNILKPRLHGPYLEMTFVLPGGGRKKVHRTVHSLVAEAFHGAKGGQCVRHMDGNPLNNRPENLRWGTHAENSMDARRHAWARRWRTYSAKEEPSVVEEALGR